MNEVLDQVISKGISKGFEYCSNEENVRRLEETFLTPIIQHISRRFAWLTYSFQTMTILIILQTILIVYLVIMVRNLSSSTTSL